MDTVLFSHSMTAAAAETMILNDDGVNQSLSTLLSTSLANHLQPTDNSDLTDGTAPALNVDNLPLEQLLQSEWFHQNISQMLNISVENLTSLLINTQSPHQPQNPMILLATLTICYVLIFVAGVLGNLITCIVISRNRFMHTATNYYLFNLAVSDLILLLSGMPQEFYNLWYPNAYPFTDVLCVLESVLSETAANATVLTITAFTVERYIAICHPFRQHTMSKLSRAIKFIFAIWMAAFLLALPQATQFSVLYHPGGIAHCTMNDDFYVHVFAVSGFIFFGGPMTAICVLYVLIGVKLKRSRLLQAVPRRCYDVNRGISAQTRVIRMLIAVAVAFFLCWAPFHAQRLMAAYGSLSRTDSKVFEKIFRILDYTSGVLYFLSTCINPLLYNIMSHKFREAFKVTLARQFGLGGKYHTQNHNYSALLRQNGSMRLHTTVNNNALEHLSSYRVLQLQCRDPSHHLSLQDSIRTTTTTTTINSGSGSGSVGLSSGGNNSCRSSHRNRCVSVGSQSGLITALGNKNDIFGANTGQVGRISTTERDNLQHRLLQTQISQLSSVGDANSLLEADVGPQPNHPYASPHPNTSYRLKELRRSLAASRQPPPTFNPKAADADCLSIDSTEWEGNNLELSRRCSETETELCTKPVVPVAAGVQPMNSIAELAVHQPTRSRLKLSRIISRRDKDTFVPQSTPRVELMRAHLPGMGHVPVVSKVNGRSTLKGQDVSAKAKVKFNSRKSVKTLETLTEKFRLGKKRKIPQCDEDDGGSTRQDSSSSTSSTGTPTANTVLMGGLHNSRGLPTTIISTTATTTAPVTAPVTREGSLKHTSANIL